MVYKVNWNMFVEIALRVTLWISYLCIDCKEPFHRKIQESDLWKYQYPLSEAFVPAGTLYLIISLAPVIVFVCEYAKTKKTEDILDGILCITLSFTLTALITTILKASVGRLRPDFYFRCFPGGRGDDFENCIGERSIVMDGRKSFPSGHSSFAFSCMTFLSLYLGRKMHLFHENGRRQSWQLCVCIFPIVISSMIAVSRTCDYRHHYEDAIAGSLLGAGMSYLCFKTYFPKMSYTIASQ